jgi:hypothetical protein
MKTLMGFATAAAATTGLLAFAAPAQAASLPCGLGSNGNTASATCWSGSPYTWRLVVDCLDTTNVKWPKTVDTRYGEWITGDGTETLSCAANLKASARLEAK